MYMTVEVHHAVKEGMEQEALQVIKELFERGLDYPGGTPSNKGLLLHDGGPGLDVVDGYRDHLGKVFSQVRRVASPQARIKVRVTS